MRYLDEYRDAGLCRSLVESIEKLEPAPTALMEVCGGQTHTIVKYGIDRIIPQQVSLIHGPGCPVCVTPADLIDKACELGSRKDVTLCSFGDMMRVPGTDRDLLTVKSQGGDVRMVYAPLDAVRCAQETPDRQVVFLGVGFETTAPANALAVHYAHTHGVENFSLLAAHVLVPPAMTSILADPDRRVQGFLAAGHVCTIMGYKEYEPIAAEYQVPIVVTGFEPVDLLQGIYMCLKQLKEGRYCVENQYARSVKPDGNVSARDLIQKIFTVVDAEWRGLGTIPRSGFGLNEPYRQYDATLRFGLKPTHKDEETECISGSILTGQKKPDECPAFGITCDPEHPLGAPMVSSEGACAAYYRYRKGQLHQIGSSTAGR